jgi:hypothetical protein
VNQTDLESTNFEDYQNAFQQIQQQIQLGVVSKVILFKLSAANLQVDFNQIKAVLQALRDKNPTGLRKWELENTPDWFSGGKITEESIKKRDETLLGGYRKKGDDMISEKPLNLGLNFVGGGVFKLSCCINSWSKTL